ncbi:MAG: MarR family transcriptional regulator [Planctomycetia bacterium]|nr:MarR family transcriptional regulator [Planctomycetia bacterium]
MTETHRELHSGLIARPRVAPADELGSDGAVAALLVRTADCLTALLRSPTATAGLNESRYNVLDALRRTPTGSSTQSALAAKLLQSESNLSTLLDRMQHDGLISRVRSETDRRKSLIRLAAAGSEALLRADLERNRAAGRILRSLDDDRAGALCDSLERLLRCIERELGIAERTAGPPEMQHNQGPRIVPAPHLGVASSTSTLEFSRSSDGHTS